MGLSLSDYQTLIVKLLPRGMAWAGANLRSLLQSFAPSLQRVDAQIETIFQEAIPSTAVQCLSDWERILGIPDEIFPLATDTATRQANIVAKLRATGGQSAAYYTSIAATLGYTITFTDCYQPFYAGKSCAGDLLYSQAWAYAFTVNVTTATCSNLTYDPTAAPNRRVYDPVLESMINTLKPAQTVVIYSYPLPAPCMWMEMRTYYPGSIVFMGDDESTLYLCVQNTSAGDWRVNKSPSNPEYWVPYQG
jgi:uncharacterized protein YmfQ (DUF2313 family)